MAKPSWIRAEDGDWYRASEVVAVKTPPHHEGGYMVTAETRRHDNVEITGKLDGAERAGRVRDDLVALLATIGGGSLVRYEDGRFVTVRPED